MVDRQTLLFMVVGLAIINGLFSPYLKVAIPISAALMPELFPRTLEWVLFWSSMLLSSATLLVSGIAAARYERRVESQSATSMWIWLGCAALLTAPVMVRG